MRLTPKRARLGTRRSTSRALIRLRRTTIPLAPFLARKGEEIISEGNPQTPGKGAPPLCTPQISQPATIRSTLQPFP